MGDHHRAVQSASSEVTSAANELADARVHLKLAEARVQEAQRRLQQQIVDLAKIAAAPPEVAK